MKRKALTLITLLSIALNMGILALANSASSSAAGINNVQVTDAEAKCTYGTSPISEFKQYQPGTLIRFRDPTKVGLAANDSCYISLSWLSEIGPSFSYSAAFARANPMGDGLEIICQTASDPACSADKFNNGQFRSLAGFYKCESELDVNCISQITVIDREGRTQDASFERHFPDAPQIPASDNPQLNYPKGGSPTLWSFTTPVGKKMIYASGVVERSFLDNGATWGGAAATFHFGLQAVNLFPHPDGIKPTLKSRKYTTPDGIAGSIVEFTKDRESGLSGDCSQYLTMDTGYCLTLADFLDGYRYRVTLQMPSDLGFFLNGRLDAPIAYTEPLGKNRKLVIEGAPATLFAVNGLVPKKYLSSTAVDAIKNARNDFGRALSFAPSDLPPMENRYPDLLTAMLPYFGDQSTFETKAWTLKSTPTLGRFTNQCTNGGRGEMLGIISTNASAFDGDPPTLDPNTKILSYKVAAPHFAVDGKTENIGKYYMNMNANFVKCILGVDKVPAVAQIGITSTGQAERVSTVTVKTDKDWLRLNVDNFTFSSPKINIKFETPATTQPLINPPQPAPIKKVATKTISCVKGKTVKKITGVSPKCPIGFKKK